MKVSMSKSAERAWVRLFRASQHIHYSVEEAFKQAGLPGLDWYDVLLELKRAAPLDLRPFKLQEKLLIKQYNLSRLLARMVDDGVLEKRACSEDGRGYGFCITAKGVEQQETMWPIYQNILATEFGAQLTDEEVEDLSTILSKVSC